MHPTIPRLRACVWVVLILIAAVTAHIASSSTPSPLDQRTEISTSRATVVKAVRTHEQVAPAQAGHLRAPGHALDLAVATDSAKPRAARWIVVNTSTASSTHAASVDSTNGERSPPTV
jgi:Tfp pilus assembly protein PilE